jgi:FAD/FMN-containing dehydrogenase
MYKFIRIENIITMQNFIIKITNIVGTSSIITDEQHKKSYETDWRKRFYGSAIAVVFPKSTHEIVLIVKLCNQSNISITPQGGNTSLCGGATPLQNNDIPQIIINLSKMNQIIDFDINNNSITIEAGCTLTQISNYALDHGLYFPLSIASEDSCQIGGNIATNAGGVHVIKYGSMRNLVLGLEVILPDGNIINQLHQLRKNNTNFDLKQLFIGSEGTLGIITKATLALYPKPLAFYTGLIGVTSISHALILLNQLKSHFNPCAFEIINKNTQDVYNDVFQDNLIPIHSEWLILFEIELFNLHTTSQQNHEYKYEGEMINDTIVAILQNQHINLNNVIIAQSNQEREQLWHIREHIPLAEHATGFAIKHDIALPISAIDEFISTNTQHLNNLNELQIIKHKLIIFGHLGDGNLHYNIQFTNHDKIQLAKLESKVNTIIYNDLIKYNGTFSAEHGIGQLKTSWYKQYSDQYAYNIAQSIKQLMDPKCLFNPNKIFSLD